MSAFTSPTFSRATTTPGLTSRPLRI
jgi:hypothetical protein